MIVITLNAANLQKVSIENATDGVMSGSKYITYRRNSRFIYFGTKSMQGKKEVCRVMTLGFCVLVCLQFRAFFTGLRNACIFPHSGDGRGKVSSASIYLWEGFLFPVSFI